MRVARVGVAQDLDDGIVYRSTWERNVARYFKFMGVDVKYEPKRFYFPGKSWSESYLPDWRILGPTPEGFAEVYIELKGWLDKKSIRRLKNMRTYYGKKGVLIILIDEDAYMRLEASYGELIPHWEWRRRLEVEQRRESAEASGGEDS